MKFYGKPNELVSTKIKKPMSKELITKHLFTFDEKGEYETEDKKLIEKLKKHFKYENNAIECDKIKCKKCGEEFENKGLLLAHYKNSHRKKG